MGSIGEMNRCLQSAIVAEHIGVQGMLVSVFFAFVIKRGGCKMDGSRVGFMSSVLRTHGHSQQLHPIPANPDRS